MVSCVQNCDTIVRIQTKNQNSAVPYSTGNEKKQEDGMKKLLTGILAGLMLVTAGCAQKSEPMTEEAVIEMVSGDMKLGGVWEDETNPKLTVIFIETGENEYDVIGHLEKSDSETEEWNMHGKYDPAVGMLSYQDGEYSVRKMTADEEIVTENEQTVTGNFGKIGEKSISWQDSALGSKMRSTLQATHSMQ